ncbi:MAG: response regulator transcription factor [Ignavibacteriae bacterium]|nr:response regulator transcription factor [Ignavibacteriota bacterium]
MTEHTQTPIRILVADDHPVFRKGLKQILEGDGTCRVIAEAGDGEVALRILREQEVDVAMLDLDMPRLNGFDVMKHVEHEHIPTDCVVITMHKDEPMFNRAMDLGCRGYVLKDNAIANILECISAVREGRYYVSPSISDYLVRRSGRTTLLSHQYPSIERLTGMERKILKLLTGLKSNKEIADELFISVKTVETHRNNICHKLDLHGTNALLKFALQHTMEL